MLYNKNIEHKIFLPTGVWQELIAHCSRKLNGNHLADECNDQKAFGLVGGVTDGNSIKVTLIVPLVKNSRGNRSHKLFMDATMEDHAVPSITPFAERGWVADQGEIDAALKTMHTASCSLIGTYHMHRVAWDHDPIRDTPTELDAILGKGSRTLMFIVSMVAPKRPIIKAFFEGAIEQQVPITII